MVIFQNRYIQAAQQLVRLWSGARGARAGPTAELRAELDALAEQAGVDLVVARRLTPESLELLVAPADTSDPLRCWLVAELFYVSARLSEREGDTAAAREADLRALHLFERVDPGRVPEAGLPDPRSRAAELRDRLEAGA
jgi:hypothetical protein